MRLRLRRESVAGYGRALSERGGPKRSSAFLTQRIVTPSCVHVRKCEVRKKQKPGLIVK